LNGVKHAFVGVDAYEIATEWGTPDAEVNSPILS
jgi:hypothetical protein